jgi:hypothetical protein
MLKYNIVNTDCSPLGPCKVVIREANSEGGSS